MNREKKRRVEKKKKKGIDRIGQKRKKGEIKD